MELSNHLIQMFDQSIIRAKNWKIEVPVSYFFFFAHVGLPKYSQKVHWGASTLSVKGNKGARGAYPNKRWCCGSTTENVCVGGQRWNLNRLCCCCSDGDAHAAASESDSINLWRGDGGGGEGTPAECEIITLIMNAPNNKTDPAL